MMNSFEIFKEKMKQKKKYSESPCLDCGILEANKRKGIQTCGQSSKCKEWKCFVKGIRR